ncbi:unnamed protein product [Litomosoides sigmodontis]|uniref:Ashwin n=1 Tax=Litomosoides sigmodontis TaxID=42156 RepID=A0A3P6TQX6_LITSI|nr:unnamed protein product [Litomosoides sigmodontis]
MRNDEDEVVPSMSTCLFPDLMTRDEILAVLKHKFRRIGVHTSNIGKLSDDELLEQFKKFAMPKPQRKGRISCNSLNRFENVADSNNLEVSVAALENSGSVCSGTNPINRRRTSACRKRLGTSNVECNAVKMRKHSPIQFP